MSALILVQIALGSLLFLKLGTTETRLQAAFESIAPLNQARAHSAETGDKPVNLSLQATLPTQATLTARSLLPVDQQLRLIIREELVAALDDLMQTEPVDTGTLKEPVYDEIEMEYRRELALVQMESLKAQTQVSSGDLEGLIGDIAKLNAANRIELFQKLNRAMNTGEIKGHL